MEKLSWGILSTAKVGIEKVIPAMQKGKYSQINAIASRSIEKAQKAAQRLGIPKTYGSYEQLLKDPEIGAVYIPLPNHLHVEWTLLIASGILTQGVISVDFIVHYEAEVP